ncbi:MAG: hypothetical protein IPG39_03670 [Bacteroidetes bacterium]|nr:hypothetical protein [Bacteroidota bacterium]
MGDFDGRSVLQDKNAVITLLKLIGPEMANFRGGAGIDLPEFCGWKLSLKISAIDRLSWTAGLSEEEQVYVTTYDCCIFRHWGTVKAIETHAFSEV